MNEEEEDMLYREMSEEDSFYMGPKNTEDEVKAHRIQTTQQASKQQKTTTTYSKKKTLIYIIITIVVYIVIFYLFIIPD